MKRLIVMRHAKSDWETNTPDHERPLNRRGFRSARIMGVALAKMGQAPQHVITSSATRARTTTEVAASVGSWDASITISDELYGATVYTALAVIATAPTEVDTLMVVGHQPTWGQLVFLLTGGAVQVKTATAVGIDLAINRWTDAPQARGSVTFVLHPRLFTAGNFRLPGI
ncbi:MAG: histidine phosphatase family protein [Acidobacteria bacterium]|nr:histidine phosphatase family protein [Acidobacteriota bacterium]